MGCEQTVKDVENASQDYNPGGLKVEITAPSVLIRQDVAVAGGHQVSRRGDGDFEQRRGIYIAGFAPIEARVGDQNFNAADQQSEETQGGDPVGDADQGGVPRGNRGGLDGGGGT